MIPTPPHITALDVCYTNNTARAAAVVFLGLSFVLLAGCEPPAVLCEGPYCSCVEDEDCMISACYVYPVEGAEDCIPSECDCSNGLVDATP